MISAWAVGSFVDVTRLQPSPMISPSFAMTQPNGPPEFASIPLSASSIARCMNFLSVSFIVTNPKWLQLIFRFLLRDRSGNDKVGIAQSLFSRLPIDTCFEHYQCYSQIAVSFIHQGLHGSFVQTGFGPQYTQTALPKFDIRRLDVRHTVSVNITEADHRDGRDHVENHLLRGAGFHSGRAGYRFGADDRNDGDIDGLRYRGIGDAGYAGAETAKAFCLLNGADGVW